MTRSWRPVAALLCFGASLLALLGSFLDLFVGTFTIGRTDFRLEINGWGMSATESGRAQPEIPIPIVPNATPIIVGAVILLAAAVIGVLSAAAPGSTGLARWSNALIAVGAAFAIGTAVTVAMDELAWQDFFRRLGSDSDLGEDGASTSGTVGIGFWMLVIASALTIAAGVITWHSTRPGAVLAEREEPETPPLGIPVVVHRLPDEPPEEP
jgi:hypothetical protein